MVAPPRVIYLAVTERCSLRCVHCEMWRSQTTDLPTETMLGFIDELGACSASGFLHIVGGEPLQRTDIEQLIRHAVLRGFRVGLVTNGWPVTPNRARSLAEAGLEIAYVSLDGMSAATVDVTRGREGSFEHARRAIDCFQAVGLEVVLSSILHAKNALEFPDLVAFAHDRGLHIMAQTLNQTLGEAPDRLWWQRSELWPHTQAEHAAIASALDVLSAASVSGLVLNTDTQLATARAYYRDPTAPPDSPCPAGSVDCGIGHDGSVRPCFYRAPIGRLGGSEPFAALWTSARADACREDVARCGDYCRLNTSNISRFGDS